MELLNHFQQLLYALFTPLFSYMRDAFQWWLAQVLAVPWGRIGDLPGPKILLLIATASIVAYFLYRAALELYTAGEKAFSAFVTLLRVFAKNTMVTASDAFAAAPVLLLSLPHARLATARNCETGSHSCCSGTTRRRASATRCRLGVWSYMPLYSVGAIGPFSVTKL